ncbi:saccharopine dehydrogenase family protein [Nocardioides marmoribigeumensis]|uniref:Short subunit dehydrogenase-like uncharacterized protein n=1 Tax=Nocardioides marmoribigeumensis TaxID=433649 RepID=A0ABU2BY56_9ACTN|nr:saccharopine dehydrogenase NADP-binding domain-containing protein [Nocardioides marmoribigeumensis]MDR7363325.1 short subunit dehydrogenase-like uncharacterized protein [Nocardioides marmoribigeumensis]
MTSRIVLFGATGYTGELTARALARRGATTVLAGRNGAALARLAKQFGDTETAVADATDPAAVRALLQPGDVLVSTVGPFLKLGQAAVSAAAEVGAHYLDSTGEGPFIRSVFEQHGPVAERNGATLLTGFGYDFVPGNLAGALALEDAPDATGVDVCYLVRDFGTSGGTRASVVGVMLEDGYAFSGGRLRAVRPGSQVRRFEVSGRAVSGISVSGTEQLGLPASYAGLRDVGVFLAVPSRAARAFALSGLAMTPVRRIAPLRAVASGLADRLVKGSTGGPSEEQRSRTGVEVVGEASRDGRVVGRSHLRGTDPYDFTAEILAWGATTAAEGGLKATGARGPVEAFGLDALAEGCAEAGLRRV